MIATVLGTVVISLSIGNLSILFVANVKETHIQVTLYLPTFWAISLNTSGTEDVSVKAVCFLETDIDKLDVVVCSLALNFIQTCILHLLLIITL